MSVGPRSFTILLIDDDEMVRDTVAEVLQADGHRILSASSGRDGLAMVRAVRPDLILVDYHMPMMSGLEVVERLKADVETRRVPVVALTSATSEEANKLSHAGCLAFIPKPFEPTELRRLIAEVLRETVIRSRRVEQ
jgi:CheY-like chemotaxis protein